MNKERIQTISLLCVSALALYGVIRTHTLLDELDASQRCTTDEIIYLSSEIGSLRHSIQILEETIHAQDSLFLHSETALLWKDNAITLTVTATPKSLANDETLYLAVNGKEVAFTGDTATIILPFEEQYEPTLCIRSSDGVCNEALDTIYTARYLASNITTNFMHDSNDPNDNVDKTLELILSSDVLNDDTIANATIKVAATNAEMGSSTSEQETLNYLSGNYNYDTLAGDEDAIVFVDGRATYSLAPYLDKQDGVTYQVFLRIEDVYSNHHTSNDAVAEFSRTTDGSFSSAGRCDLNITMP